MARWSQGTPECAFKVWRPPQESRFLAAGSFSLAAPLPGAAAYLLKVKVCTQISPSFWPRPSPEHPVWDLQTGRALLSSACTVGAALGSLLLCSPWLWLSEVGVQVLPSQECSLLAGFPSQASGSASPLPALPPCTSRDPRPSRFPNVGQFVSFSVLFCFLFLFKPHHCRCREVLAFGKGFVLVRLWVPSSGIVPLARWPTGLGDLPLPPPSPLRGLA